MFGQNESLINKTCVAVMNCKTSHFYKSIRSLATKVQPTISAIPLIFKILFFRENERRKIYLWTEFLFEKKKNSWRSFASGHFRPCALQTQDLNFGWFVAFLLSTFLFILLKDQRVNYEIVIVIRIKSFFKVNNNSINRSSALELRLDSVKILKFCKAVEAILISPQNNAYK